MLEDADVETFRSIRSAPTVSTSRSMGDLAEDNERVVLSVLDKCHSFLFHGHMHAQMATPAHIEEDTKEPHGEGGVDIPVLDKQLSIGTNTNKFVSQMDSNRLAQNSYSHGQHMVYHDMTPRFLCLKDELMGNDIHVITNTTWNDTLQKALHFLQSV